MIREMQDAELLTTSEFLERKKEILDQSTREQNDIILKGAELQLGAASDLFGSLSDIAAAGAGEQSAIYKAMFTAQKAFAIAQAIVNIQRGISEAAALPFPANIPAIASVAAATASIVSNIQAVRLKLADGGSVGERFDGLVSGRGSRKSDSIPTMLSRDEFVVNADDAQPNLEFLKDLNNGRYRNGIGRQAFRDGGRVGAPPANSRRSSSRGSGAVSRGGDINVGGIHLTVPEGADRAKADQFGQDLGKAFVRQVLKEESAPMGFLDVKYGGGV